MTSLFQQKQYKAKPQKFGKYGNPFTLSPEQEKAVYIKKLEGRAAVIKMFTKTSSSIKEIAAELDFAEMRRKK